MKTIKRVIPRSFLREFCVFESIFDGKKLVSYRRKKYEITLEVIMDSILTLWDQKNSRSPRFYFFVHGLWGHVWDFDLFVMASLWTKVFNKETWTIFCLRWAHAGLRPFSPFVGCSRPVMVAPMHRLVLPKTSSGHFQKGSNLLIWNIDQFIRWVSHWMMTDVTTCKMPVKWWSDSCTHCSIGLCHCCFLFLDQSKWPWF